LYSLECGETEFHNLKNEQSLIVDFQAFPSKFIELLELCAKKEEEVQRFFCVLCTGFANDAFLNIIETNQFKQLTHLSLKFKAGWIENSLS
jgi:spindle assembly abnormal protein 6